MWLWGEGKDPNAEQAKAKTILLKGNTKET